VRLIDCFTDLMAYAAYCMARAEHEPQAYEQFKKDVETLIEQGEKQRVKAGFSDEDYESARFAVFAWVDETVLCSTWPEKLSWKKEQLQLLHFNTTNAGEEFYARLDALTPEQKAVQEVYCTCLTLGFRGRYHAIRDLIDWEAKVNEALGRLVDLKTADYWTSDEVKYFPPGYLSDKERARRKFRLGVAPFVLLLILAASAFLIGVYFWADLSLKAKYIDKFSTALVWGK
jgi:type VI secretion system protein ImpK